jgi:uncharacterized RDD family membrane protein YckC
MTQQNETEQQPVPPEQQAAAASATPAKPAYPSPYLDGGEAMPQAYLAPPQPGQPRYGTAPGAPGGRPFGNQSRYGGGQPRYGQPATAQPGPGRPAAARRDPALAPAWHRFAAATIDWFIIITLSTIPFWSPLAQLAREAQAIATHYQSQTSPAAQAALNSILRAPANEHTLVYWCLSMFGIALIYYWVQHAAWGATVGKRALGVRVVQATDRSSIGVRQAGIRTVAFLVGPAILMLLGVVGNPINIVGGVLWAADAGVTLFDSQAQSLHDKLADTVVVRQRSLDQRSRRAQPW